MSQRLPVKEFTWVKEKKYQNLTKTSYKNTVKIVKKDIFLK